MEKCRSTEIIRIDVVVPVDYEMTTIILIVLDEEDDLYNTLCCVTIIQYRVS